VAATNDPPYWKRLAAEFLGTFILVFFAVGSAVFGIEVTGIGYVGVAITFGFTLGALVYAIGPVSGCHVNPAVTVGALLTGRIDAIEAVGRWIVQIAGGIAGAAMLKLLTGSFGKAHDYTGNLGSNGYGVHISEGGAFVLEIVMTFLLVFVVLMATEKVAAVGFAGLAIGIVLTAIHMVGIPLDGTSVNPARSIGPALFAGGTALSQLWLFIVAPMIGGIIAAGVQLLIRTEETPLREELRAEA